jgi:hypothetical protein
MRQFRPMTAVSTLITVICVIFWGAAMLAPLGPRGLACAVGAAVAATPTAAACWLAAWLRGRAMLYLADALVASRRAALKTTAPLRAVRVRAR